MRTTGRHILGYTIGFITFILLVPYGFYKLSELNKISIIEDPGIRLLVSLPFFILGGIFAIWSNVFLLLVGKGGPVEGLGIAISPPTQKLVTTGPYRCCRNPMVFGAFMLYVSVNIYLGSLLGLIILVLFFIAGVFYLRFSEEKRLVRDFGQEYLDYRKSVPMIVPFVI